MRLGRARNVDSVSAPRSFVEEGSLANATAPPIELQGRPMPNGWQLSIVLEDCGLPYAFKMVDITCGEQFRPSFLAIASNNRMPAIVDADGPDRATIAVCASGAPLDCLADKTGRLAGETARKKVAVRKWLFRQVGGLAPMAGQVNQLRLHAAEKIPYAIDRCADDVNRLFGVMNARLPDDEYLVGLIRSPIWLRSDGYAYESGRARRLSPPKARVRGAENTHCRHEGHGARRSRAA